MMSSVDSGFRVSKHHQVCLQNLSYNSWVDFVNYDEIGIVADSSKFFFLLLYMWCIVSYPNISLKKIMKYMSVN